MASGTENFARQWSGNENYQTAINADNVTQGGFIWSRMGGLNLDTNAFEDDTDLTPNYTTVAVLIIDTVIGAAVTNPDISIEYVDKDAVTRMTSVQVLPGMQELTSISVPLPNGMAVILNLSTNVDVSGIISIWGAQRLGEEFNPMFGLTTVWSAATPGL